LVQGEGSQLGLQAFVVPFEGSSITLDQIMNDIPNINVYDARPVSIGGSENGVAFIREDGGGNLTREIWFAYKGYVFQVTSFAKYEDLLVKVLETFQLKY